MKSWLSIGSTASFVAGHHRNAWWSHSAAECDQRSPICSLCSRAVVVGPRLFTVSNLGVKANGLESFVGAGWAAFPQPPAPPDPIDVPAPLPG